MQAQGHVAKRPVYQQVLDQRGALSQSSEQQDAVGQGLGARKLHSTLDFLDRLQKQCLVGSSCNRCRYNVNSSAGSYTIANYVRYLMHGRPDGGVWKAWMP